MVPPPSRSPKAVREGLESAGIRIVPLTELPSLKH